MIKYPIQKFDLIAVNNVNSEPKLIFGSQNTCIIESMVFSNNLSTPVFFSFYLLREEGTPPVVSTYTCASSVSLDNNQSIDWLYNKNSLFLRAEDTLWAYSDYYDNVFNVFISYRELTEVVNV